MVLAYLTESPSRGQALFVVMGLAGKILVHGGRRWSLFHLSPRDRCRRIVPEWEMVCSVRKSLLHDYELYLEFLVYVVLLVLGQAVLKWPAWQSLPLLFRSHPSQCLRWGS